MPLSNTSSGTWTNAVVSTSKLYFVPSSGTLTATDFNSLSDITFKTNINVIDSPLERIAKLTGITFDWINSTNKSAGLIAQEVEKVLPEAVKINSESNQKTLNYNAVIGLLVEGLKHQQLQIDKLTNQIKKIMPND